MRLVIDTNVLMIADRRGSDITQLCVDSAIECVASLSDGNVICLDEDDAILDEYAANIKEIRPYSLVAKLLIDLRQQRYSASNIHRAPLPKNHAGEYKDCPQSLIDANFDRSDRKFVALAKVTQATVCNAVDTDWFDHADLLCREGIQVNNLCGTDPDRYRATPSSAG